MKKDVVTGELLVRVRYKKVENRTNSKFSLNAAAIWSNAQAYKLWRHTLLIGNEKERPPKKSNEYNIAKISVKNA